jgi:hypothetical protein
VVVLSALVIVAALAVVSDPAGAHRSGCHGHHSCPSDHATYRWHGWLCVKPSADERTSRFRHRIRYGGHTYYCHR